MPAPPAGAEAAAIEVAWESGAVPIGPVGSDAGDHDGDVPLGDHAAAPAGLADQQPMCGRDALLVLWDLPDTRFEVGAHIAPLGPADALDEAVDGDAVNGIVVCDGWSYAYMGFEALWEDDAWSISPVPVLGEHGEEPANLDGGRAAAATPVKVTGAAPDAPKAAATPAAAPRPAAPAGPRAGVVSVTPPAPPPSGAVFNFAGGSRGRQRSTARSAAPNAVMVSLTPGSGATIW